MFIIYIKSSYINDAEDIIKKNENLALNYLQDSVIKKGVSVYLRIALNYFQVNAIISSMNIEWPYEVRQYLGFFSTLSDFSSQILSFDCFLYEIGAVYKSIYIRTILSIALPAIISFYSYIHYFCKKVCKGSAKKRKLIVALLGAHFFSQPSILKQLLENFDCMVLGDERFLVSQMDLKCHDQEFQKWVRKFFFNLFYFNLFFYK